MECLSKFLPRNNRSKEVNALETRNERWASTLIGNVLARSHVPRSSSDESLLRDKFHRQIMLSTRLDCAKSTVSIGWTIVQILIADHSVWDRPVSSRPSFVYIVWEDDRERFANTRSMSRHANVLGSWRESHAALHWDQREHPADRGAVVSCRQQALDNDWSSVAVVYTLSRSSLVRSQAVMFRVWNRRDAVVDWTRSSEPSVILRSNGCSSRKRLFYSTEIEYSEREKLKCRALNMIQMMRIGYLSRSRRVTREKPEKHRTGTKHTTKENTFRRHDVRYRSTSIGLFQHIDQTSIVDDRFDLID